MTGRTRTLRFTAVLAFVTLSLTGFSTGHHRGGHGSGGGCSSSRQDHDTSTSTSGGSGSDDYSDDSGTSGASDDDSYGSSGSSGTSGGTGGSHYTRRPTHRATSTPSGGSSKPLENGEAKLISCATEKRPYATVEVTNPNSRKAAFSADVSFYDDSDSVIGYGFEYVTVPAKGTTRVRVKPYGGDGTGIDHCRVEPEAEPE
ncbi:hypothetical protein [Streptomyces sp. NPDC020298]|uniref:hypothetical protein n=1 Tax=unclassified Streptomyces TaxID=2593676 RepID=UPI0033F5D24E